MNVHPHAGDEKERYPSNEIIHVPRIIITILFTYWIGIIQGQLLAPPEGSGVQ